MRRIFVLVFVASCGTPTGDVDVFIEGMAQQQCGWLYKCCRDDEIRQQEGDRFQIEAQCAPFKELSFKKQLYIQRLGVSEGRLRVDTEQMQKCLEQLAARACNPKPGTTPSVNPMAMDECKRVFVGNTDPGNECLYADECKSGGRCVTDALRPVGGVCIPYQAEGEICNDASDCDPSVTQIYCAKKYYHCEVRKRLGETCSYTTDETGKNPKLPLTIECDTTAGNLYCDPGTQTCKQLPGNGDPCLTNLPPGATTVCDPNPALRLVCDTGGVVGGVGVCRAPGKDGDDCTRIACDTGLYCNRTLTPPLCRTLPGKGQSCVSTGGCQKPYFCNTAKTTPTCDEPAALGQACTNMPCDTPFYCDTTQFTPICAQKLLDGDPCSSPLQCLSADCRVVGGAQVCQPRAVVGVQCSGR